MLYTASCKRVTFSTICNHMLMWNSIVQYETFIVKRRETKLGKFHSVYDMIGGPKSSKRGLNVQWFTQHIQKLLVTHVFAHIVLCMPLAFCGIFQGHSGYTFRPSSPQIHLVGPTPSHTSFFPARGGLPWNTGGGRERNCWCRTGPGQALP